jgi:hypothetical protein
MSSNFVIEVASSSAWWQSNVIDGDCILRATDSNRSICMSANSNASYVPLSVHDGVVTIPTLSNPQLIMSAYIGAVASNIISYGTTCSNIATAALNSTNAYTMSNFSLLWAGSNSIGSGAYYYGFPGATLVPALSYCPNTAMSNLVAGCWSNGFLKTPMKGMYTFEWCMNFSNVRPGNMQVLFINGSYSLAASDASAAKSLSASITMPCNDGFTMQRLVHNAVGATTVTLSNSYISMTLLYPLP